MIVPVFELPGTTSNMYFVHVNLMNSVENTKILKCINSLTNKPTDQPHIEAAEVIDGS